MKNTSLKLKIIMIFLIPIVALMYFSLGFIQSKNATLDESSMYKLTAEITHSLTKLLHNLQIERGLSSGYIVDIDHTISKEKILNQYNITDKSYKQFSIYIDLDSSTKDLIKQRIESKTKPLIKKIKKDLKNINTIRQKVLNNKISFKEEINYYNTINNNLLLSVKLLVGILKKQNNDDEALFTLQKLKESTGQERAYTYNQLVSNSFDEEQIRVIKKLQEQQRISKNIFSTISSTEIIGIYNKINNKHKEKEIERFRDKFLKESLDSSSSSTWFKLSSNRIDTYEKISNHIIEHYITKANYVHKEAKNSLYLTAAIWILQIISLVGLILLLRKLMKGEEELVESLRISAYTFDSHEAMTITTVDGTILQVNNAFSRITGYSAKEVIGQNPRVLKSMQHSKQFYVDMWDELINDGKWTREIYNKRKNGEIYPERLSITAIKDKNNETTHYIAQFLDLSDLKKAQEKALHQANHDFLTNLANRKFLMQRLHEEYNKAIRHNFLHAFLFIDIDGFKNVNDNYGHEIGDKLLIAISKRLLYISREEDIVSRIGGDEFAIGILNLDETKSKSSKDIKTICNKIIATLNKPFTLNEHTVNIGASIGIKIFPNTGDDEEDIIIHADKAMYLAKERGKNQFVFFNKEIEKELKSFQVIEKELELAIIKNQFVFFYQAKIDIKTQKIIGAEALVRWEHPSKGLLFPDSFIKIATTIGIIPKITILALHDALKFLQTNKDIFDGTISINIGSNELMNPKFNQSIISIIQSYNIDPSHIELEITESELINDFENTIIKIQELRNFGIKLSIDDFGTGYSSIAYLQKLPVNSLKIDRSFLENCTNKQNQELIKLVIEMAKAFHMDSVVEGVETQYQLDFIKECGATHYQGYLFSKPTNKESFIALLSHH